MPMPQVHFAVGMGTASLLGLPMLAWRRRWLIWLPLLMTLCGGLALVPDVLTRGRDFLPGAVGGRSWAHGPAANVFFLHSWLDRQPVLYARAVSNLAFQAVALMYLASAIGYAAFIRWGIPRMPEAEEALARLRREAAGYRPVAPFVGVLPLLIAGAAVVWMLWPARRAAEPTQQGLDAAQWAQLVSRRMGVSAGRRLGVVHATWDSQGAWLCGDVGARREPIAGNGRLAAPSAAELVEQAKANGCDFVALLDAAASAEELAAARKKRPDMAILAGLVWDAPTRLGTARAIVLVPPQPREAEQLAEFRRQASGPGASAEATLRWLESHAGSERALPVVLACPSSGGEGSPELFSWRRTSEVFVGLVGLAGAERLSARDARSEWDPRVALVGGTWDRLLDRGVRLWGAAAASGLLGKRGQAPFPRAEKQPVPFSPGEFARTHVWCRGRGAEDVLDGLRRGCAWADEGAIVRALDFGVTAPTLERPARMGEVARVAPGDEMTAELALDVPPTDFAGRPNQLDEVELISSFHGDAEVVARFRNVRDVRRLEHRLPPAQDANGGLGFYVRARGWRRVGEEGRLCFYTNPIHVLVRSGPPAPPMPGAAPVRLASPGRRLEPPPKPKTATPVAPPAADDVRATLAAIGLPASVRPICVETFQKPPGRQWRGSHVSIIGDRGPALGDEELRVELIQRIPLGGATRLFFRCYAVDCPRLTLVARPGGGGTPCQAVRELPERQWAAFDLSFADAFLPIRGTSGRLRPPGDVQALEWSAARLGPLSRFYVTDVVIYDPTAASRQELARAQASVLLEELLVGLGPREPLRGRLTAARERLEAKRGQLTHEELDAAGRVLAELGEELLRVRQHAAMARTFGLPDPKFAVTFAPPGQRISARNRAFCPPTQLARSWELAAAGAEAESVQLIVIALWDKLEAVAIGVSPFLPAGGGERAPIAGNGRPIAGNGRAGLSVSLALVDEVQVRPGPSLAPEQTGWVPDPLLPFEPFDVEPGALRSVLLTFEVAPDLPPGDYEGEVSVQPRGQEPVRLAVRLRRWGFALQGQPLAVAGHLDERALSAHCAGGKAVPQQVRRELYELLLRHRVCPVPLFGGDEASDLDEALFCLGQGAAHGGAELVVLREAASAAPPPQDPNVVRAARAAAELADAGWRRRGALLLPLAPNDEPTRSRMVAFARTLAREHPSLLLLAGGDGEPPGDLITHVWRRPLGGDAPRQPRDDDVEVRLSRTARREGWDLVAAAPESPGPNLLVTSPLLHARLLPWLAWQHGVRTLFLRGVTRWREDDDLRDGVLIYPLPLPPPSLPPPAPPFPLPPGEGRGEGAGPRRDPVPGPLTPPSPKGRGGDAAGGRGAGAAEGTGGGAAGGSGFCGSLRLVALRDGVEDYACLRLLWDRARLLRARATERHGAVVQAAERLLAEAAGGMGTLQRPCRDPQVLVALRARVARELERVEAAWWAEVDAAKDLPPPPPEVAAKADGGQIVLTWARCPDAKGTAYNVYRSRDPKGGFVRLNPSPVEGLTYADRSAADGVTYHYLVRSCREPSAELGPGLLVDGPRSAVVSAAARPAPRVIWVTGAAPRFGWAGPFRAALRIEGPGTGGLLPLVRPQIAYAAGATALGGFEDMTRQEDGTWAFDVPEPSAALGPGLGWRRLAGKALRIQARIVDRQGRVVTAPVERLETIGAAP